MPRWSLLACGLPAANAVFLGLAVESTLRNNEVQTNYSSGAAIAVTQNKGRKRGEDVVVTPGSNGIFTITILMDGHGGQSVMKRAVDLQKELLEMCRSLADWPRCAVEATEHVQDHIRIMRYRSGATFLALVVEEASSKAAFAWAGDSMGILVRQGMVAFRTSSHTAESEAEISRIRHHSPPYQYRLDDGYLCALKRPSCVMPTRGLGDVDLESAGFLAVPETSDFMAMGEEDFVLIASDGIWDVLSEEDVLAHVQVGSWQTNLATSEKLAKLAVQEWLRQYGRVSEADDVSVAIVQPRLSVTPVKAEL
mmetsp:Transcript_58781/g.128699  ORF Transcript_58781/g.128699 Transcript_58781/m.128699 type:complete len:309 (-) Transcript_58781:36-962(-)